MRRWPLRTRRGVNEPARSRGTTGLEGTQLRIDHLGRHPMTGVTTGDLGRLTFLVAQVISQLRLQAPSPGPPSTRPATARQHQ